MVLRQAKWDDTISFVATLYRDSKVTLGVHCNVVWWSAVPHLSPFLSHLEQGKFESKEYKFSAQKKVGFDDRKHIHPSNFVLFDHCRALFVLCVHHPCFV